MRLIAREIHRAFPELDRFDDEKCRRFVTAAQRGKWAMLGRTILNAFLCVLLFATIMAFGALVLNVLLPSPAGQEHLHSTWRTTAWVLVLCTSITAPGIAALILRDQLLRRRVARFIHARGKCPQCRYNLLGARVPESLQINCPECGLELEVDEALTELASTDPNAPTPSAPTSDTSPLPTAKPRERRLARTNELDRWPSWFTPKRRKRTLHTLIAALILAITIPAAWWGSNWYALQAQAKRAAAQRIGLVGIDKISESLNPPDNGAMDAWGHFAEVLRIKTQAETEVGTEIVTEHKLDENTPGGAQTVLASGRIRPAYESMSAPTQPDHPDELIELNIDFARRVSIRMIELGADDHLKAMIAAPRAIALRGPPFPGAPPNNAPAVPTFQAANTASMLEARMRTAIKTSNLPEFDLMLRAMLKLASMIDRDPVMISCFFADSVESRTHIALQEFMRDDPPAEWLYSIHATLNECLHQRTPLSKVLNAEREYALDAVRWYFVQPGAPLTAIMPRWFASRTGATPDLLPVGTLEDNIADVNAFFDAATAAFSVPHTSRSQLKPLPNAQHAVAMVLTEIDIGSHLTGGPELLRAATLVMLALERHKAAYAKMPESLIALVPEFLPVLPKDPFDPEGLFRYRVVCPPPCTAPNYLLYSVGFDSHDSGGARGSVADLGAISAWGHGGLDFIIHRPEPLTAPTAQPTRRKAQ